MNSNPIRVLIIANDPLARAGLSALIENRSGCIVVGRLPDSSNSHTDIDLYRPDVLLWDLGWKPLDFIDALAEMQDFNVPIVALVPDEVDIAAIWHTGVRGLLLRDTTAARISAALSGAVQGLMMLEPPLSHPGLIMPQEIISQDSLPHLNEPLTPRELEVLHLLAKGLPNKAIALNLDISEHTVKFHVNAIMSKLSAQSRTAAVVNATRMGLVLL